MPLSDDDISGDVAVSKGNKEPDKELNYSNNKRQENTLEEHMDHRSVGVDKYSDICLTEVIDMVLITCIINTMNGKDVALDGVPGTYLGTKIDEDCTVILWEKLSHLLILLYFKLYGKYDGTETKGKAVLYVNLKKAV